MIRFLIYDFNQLLKQKVLSPGPSSWHTSHCLPCPQRTAKCFDDSLALFA